MQVFNRPVIPLVLSYMFGIGLGARLGGSCLPALILCALSAAYVVRQRLNAKSLLLAPIILLAALGYLSILPWVAPRFPPHHVFHQLEAEQVTLIGEVCSRPSRQSWRTHFIFESRWRRSEQSVSKSAGKVRVTISGDAPLIERGQTIELTGRLRALKNFQNPGGFDYKRRMAFEEIWASLYTSAKRVQIVADQARGGLSGNGSLTVILDRIRRDAGRLIESYAGGDPAAVLKALLVGDRSQITPELRQIFSQSGVSHILAISGLHIGIVATTAFALLSWLLRQFRWILLRGWNRRAAALFTLIPVLAYGLIAGMSPSTQRAVLMAVVFLMAYWIGREQDAFSSLAAAALIILIVYPPSLFAISFQLSFAAVFAIFFGLNRTRPQPRKSLDDGVADKALANLGRLLIGMVKVSVFAIWGTLPLAMTYFNQISFVGVVANLVVVPAMGFCVVPLGLAALCIWPIWAHFAGVLISLAAWLLSLILPAVETLAGFPLASLNTWTPTTVELACFYLISVSGLMLAARRSCRPLNGVLSENDESTEEIKNPIRDSGFPAAVIRRWGRNGSAAVLWLALTLSSAGLGADTLYWLNQRFWHRDLKIHILDVGNGNASLVEFPGGHTLLIDGGGFADIAAFDVGASVVAPYLRRRKIMTVDTLILSHPNSDHLNGLIHISEHFNVKQLWTNGEPRPSLGYKLLMESGAANRIHSPDFKALARLQAIGGVQIRILYPPPDFLSMAAIEHWRSTNNSSLVVQLRYGDHSFLFPGDITRKAEAELVARSGPEVRSNVLVVPHHGSKSSSSPAFISAVKPDIAIVSARDRGKRRHPHPTVADRYRRHRCRLFLTEEQGAIRLISDGRNLKVEPFVKQEGRDN